MNSWIPTDGKQLQKDRLIAYRFALTAMLSGLLTIGIGDLLGSWMG